MLEVAKHIMVGVLHEEEAPLVQAAFAHRRSCTVTLLQGHREFVRAALKLNRREAPCICIFRQEVAVGPAIDLVKLLKNKPFLKRMCLVVLIPTPDARRIEALYELGVNSVVVVPHDATVAGPLWEEIATYWTNPMVARPTHFNPITRSPSQLPAPEFPDED
ncbi:MAG TPA: hypothetical protein VEH27_00495 [Methylomirabilota bacterium]|nr:hypothetical protein [Methylomirabilota bacterium]